MVEYIPFNGVPGQRYFRCEKMRATLSTEACATNWRRSNYERNDDRSACKCCPIGALHAGDGDASMSPFKDTTICARCHRTDGRLIRGMICVSCYNREREQLLGRNAKGTAPVKLPPLHRIRLQFIHGHELRVLVLDRAIDINELIIAALRDSPKRVRFAFFAAPPQLRQLRLF